VIFPKLTGSLCAAVVVHFKARVTGRWVSADPALGEYFPVPPVGDSAKKKNDTLPGMGGVFNIVNLDLYHYAGLSPIRYSDPTGKDIIISRDGGIHVNLYLQDKEGNWYLFDMAMEGYSKEDKEKGLKITKAPDGKSGDYFATVKFQKIENDQLSTHGNVIKIKTTKEQDNKIYENAKKISSELTTTIKNENGTNIRQRYYNTLNYNCLISSLDVINSSGAGITVPTYNRSLVLFWMYDIKSANFWYNIFPALKPDDFPVIINK
jgi:hypothetical protein